MRIIDRYIAKKFFTVLMFTTLAFIAIFIVVDLIEHLDKFLSSDAPTSYTFIYYLYYIPYIITLTLPVNMLLSSLFSLGSMAQYNELISCLSSGISLYRLVLPLLLIGLMVSIVAGVGAETLVPKANRARLDIYRHEIRNQPREPLGTQRQISVQDRGERQMSIEFYNGRKKRANKVNLVWRKGNEITARWDIRYMEWNPDSSGWLMHHVIQRTFEDSVEHIRQVDTLWYTDTQVFPEDLLDLEIKPEEMTYLELERFVAKMESLGADARKWKVDLNMKISYPFANFIIVLFGAPLASRKRRSGPALGFALALLISFIYFVFVRTGQVLGHGGSLSPFLGAWIGNMIFGAGGILLMLGARK